MWCFSSSSGVPMAVFRGTDELVVIFLVCVICYFLIWCAHAGGGVAASILGEAFEALTFNIFVHHMCLGIWCAHAGLCVVGDTTLEQFNLVRHFSESRVPTQGGRRCFDFRRGL